MREREGKTPAGVAPAIATRATAHLSDATAAVGPGPSQASESGGWTQGEIGGVRRGRAHARKGSLGSHSFSAMVGGKPGLLSPVLASRGRAESPRHTGKEEPGNAKRNEGSRVGEAASKGAAAGAGGREKNGRSMWDFGLPSAWLNESRDSQPGHSQGGSRTARSGESRGRQRAGSRPEPLRKARSRGAMPERHGSSQVRSAGHRANGPSKGVETRDSLLSSKKHKAAKKAPAAELRIPRTSSSGLQAPRRHSGSWDRPAVPGAGAAQAPPPSMPAAGAAEGSTPSLPRRKQGMPASRATSMKEAAIMSALSLRLPNRPQSPAPSMTGSFRAASRKQRCHSPRPSSSGRSRASSEASAACATGPPSSASSPAGNVAQWLATSHEPRTTRFKERHGGGKGSPFMERAQSPRGHRPNAQGPKIPPLVVAEDSPKDERGPDVACEAPSIVVPKRPSLDILLPGRDTWSQNSPADSACQVVGFSDAWSPEGTLRFSGEMSSGDNSDSTDQSDAMSDTSEAARLHQHAIDQSLFQPLTESGPWAVRMLAKAIQRPSAPTTPRLVAPSESQTLAKSGIEREYQFGEILGYGSFGLVRDCTNVKTLRRYACKVVSKKGLKGDKDLFMARREFVVQQRLGSHPNVLRAVALYESEESLCILLEKGYGGDLLELLEAAGPMSEAHARALFYQIVLALKHCAKNCVLHRDVKLENIMVVEPQCTKQSATKGHTVLRRIPTLKLSDFGSALLLPPGGKTSGRTGGSKMYQAPEVLSGQEFGFKADVWSLGVVLCALLTGAFPFTAPTESLLTGMIKRGLFSMEGPLWASVSAEAKDLVASCLRVDPTRRASIDDVARHPWVAKAAAEEAAARISRSVTVWQSEASATLPRSTSMGYGENENRGSLWEPGSY